MLGAETWTGGVLVVVVGAAVGGWLLFILEWLLTTRTADPELVGKRGAAAAWRSFRWFGSG